MFKYVWIIILVLVSVFGWIYSIYDIVLTVQDKGNNDDVFDIFYNLEEFTQFWIIGFTIVCFAISLIAFLIAKIKGA